MSQTSKNSQNSQIYKRNLTLKLEESTLPPSHLMRLLFEARWLILMTLTGYLAMIFLSYSKSDPGWSYTAVVPGFHNAGGRFGAWLSDLLFFIFGFSAWWMVVFMIVKVIQDYRQLFLKLAIRPFSLATDSYEGWTQSAGFIFMLAASAALEALRLHSLPVQLSGSPGGAIGQLISHVLYDSLGFIGATLFFIIDFWIRL